MDLIRATSGTATIFGLDSHRDAVEVKKLVGYVPGELPNFGGLRGRQVVAYMAGLRGGQIDDAVIEDICTRFNLDLGQRFREYSRGNKQKLAILLGFMHRPRLLILDEPTGGLDPLNQQEFNNLVREARDRGATFFLSSHILSEVEHVCDRVGIIRAGRQVRVARLDELHDIRFHQVTILFAGDPPVMAIKAAEGVDRVEVEDHRVNLIVRGTFEPLIKAIADAHVVNVTSHEPSLEEIFLTYYRGDGAAPDEAKAESATRPDGP